MTDFGVAAAERLRRTYMTAAVVEQRRSTITRLSIQPGERVLDLGCGPGFLALEMAEQVGSTGQVLAVDPSGPMRAITSEEVRAHGLSEQMTVVDGDTGSIPVHDGAVDAAAAVQVLEHVADVVGALAELHRVLRPGGRLVVVDTDWRSCIWHSVDPGRTERVISAWRSRFQHPQLPAELGPALQRAGFDDVAVEPLPLLECRTDTDTYSLGMAAAIADFVAGRPEVGPVDAAAWREDVLARAEDGTYFFSLSRHLFSATR